MVAGALRPFLSAPLRSLPLSRNDMFFDWRLHTGPLNNAITSAISVTGQIRFKASTRQTKPAGKNKSGKLGDNRSAQTKGYLKKGQNARENKSNVSGGEGKTDRFEVMRQILYEVDPQNLHQPRLEKLKTIIPDPDIHETIHRAWQLCLRHKREQFSEKLERQYLALDHALEELRLADRQLYLKTIKDEHGSFYRLQNVSQPNSQEFNVNATGKLVGLFPRQMRIPTELPPEKGKMWDHDWKNPIDPLSAQ